MPAGLFRTGHCGPNGCLEGRNKHRRRFQQRQREPHSQGAATSASNAPQETPFPAGAAEVIGDADVTAQLQLQLFRVYASINRQSEWFALHEANAMALAVEAEKLRKRFLPHEPSLLQGVCGDVRSTENTAQPPLSSCGVIAVCEETSPYAFAPPRVGDARAEDDREVRQKVDETCGRGVAAECDRAEGGDSCRTERWAAAEVPGFSATPFTPEWGNVAGRVRHLVPAYLLQLTPSWIHEQFSPRDQELPGCEASRPPDVESFVPLASLLLPVLRSLHNVVGTARWSVRAANTSQRCAGSTLPPAVLSAVAKHLFYLLHEVLSCMSLRAVPPAALGCEERVEGTHVVQYFLQQWDLLSRLLCSDGNSLIGGTDIPLPCCGTRVSVAPTAGAVHPSAVMEAFSLLSDHYLLLNNGD